MLLEHEEYKEPFIVGYIEKSEELVVEGKRRVLKGQLLLFRFEESVPYYHIFPRFAPMKLVDENKTAEIKRRFPSLTEQQRSAFLRRCVMEIKRLDERNTKHRKTCLVLRDRDCHYKNTCLRWNQ